MPAGFLEPSMLNLLRRGARLQVARAEVQALRARQALAARPRREGVRAQRLQGSHWHQGRAQRTCRRFMAATPTLCASLLSGKAVGEDWLRTSCMLGCERSATYLIAKIL